MSLRTLTLALACVSLLACSASSLGIAPTQPRGCAERFAASQASPDAVVPGSWDCLAASLQRRMQVAGYPSSDAAMQKMASTAPIYRHFHLIATAASGAVVFELTGDTGEDEILVIHLDAQGHIDSGGSANAAAPASATRP